MTGRLTIVGQGLAGSMLGWACEQAEIPFRIIDRGHLSAASRVGAGLVSPLTGRRLVPTWRLAEWREDTLVAYRELERVFACPLVRLMRLRRLYRDGPERARFEARLAEPDVAPWIESADADGVWMRGAFQVDTARLIACFRRRWIERGWLTEREFWPESERREGSRTIWCVGADSSRVVASIAWELSQGELLVGRLPGLASDLVLNDGQWVLPMPGERVRVGATFVRNVSTLESSVAAQQTLQDAAQRLTGRRVEQPESVVGWRVNLTDRRPVVGWLNGEETTGVFAGLAAKGAVWAPLLARQWAADGLRGLQIDPEARVARFLPSRLN